MSFLDEARQTTKALRAAILDLPFNRELAAGVLSSERFRGYLIQDSLYLTQYARALSLLAAKAPSPAEIVQFAQAASATILFEQMMHQHYLAHFGVTAAAIQHTDPSPICLAYTSFMLAEAVIGNYHTLLAAILPCFSVYAEVGTAIAANSRPDNPFQRWIDTYAAPEFLEAVQAAEATTNHAAKTASPATRQRMLQLFQRSTEFEWLFWDAAWRLESWPTASFRQDLPTGAIDSFIGQHRGKVKNALTIEEMNEIATSGRAGKE